MHILFAGNESLHVVFIKRMLPKGAVLIAAMESVIIGVIVFGPYILELKGEAHRYYGFR
jgi:hypothetical protein